MAAAPSFGETVRAFARIAALSFGGPAGQIAVMHRILVTEKGWLSEARFLHALNYCMLLPGPEAQQLTVYAGWLLHKVRGGLVAGILFVLPGFAAILALSIVYALYGQVGAVAAVFFGIKAAVLAIVLHALAQIAGRALGHPALYGLAATAFVAIFFFDVAFPAIIIVAAAAGYLGGLVRPSLFAAKAETAGTDGPEDIAATTATAGGHTSPALGRALRVLAVCLTLWFAPLAALALALGGQHVLVQEGIFFSKTAVVSFGGAYAVLAYVAQQAVQTHGWLLPGEMLDGLGLAETTPGPLIMVVQFVGFLGAYRAAGAVDPLLMGTLGALVTTWVTFVPCFLWIFLGAPYIEALRGNRHLTAALTGITAAVVGVVANLAIWFAQHVLFAENTEFTGYGLSLDVPVWASLQPGAAVLAAAAAVALTRFRLGMLAVLGGCAVAGAAYRWALSGFAGLG